MATVAVRQTPVEAERRFFLVMAVAVGATVFAGFGLDFRRFDWDFSGLPLHVHLHGAVFSAWILLYMLQNWLVDRGSIALHRRLGVLAAGLAAVMVVVGVATTILAIELHRVPSFFPPGVFLMLDLLGIGGFGALTAAAIAMRHQPDWHKRLMLCGTLLVMSPALGRLLPMPALGAYGPAAVFIAMVLYVIAAIAFDLRLRGTVHPAYWWGGGVLVVTQVLVGPLGFSTPVQAWVDSLAA